MKKVFQNIILLVFATITLFVSMGINISKMQCDKGSRVFIGTEAPKCKAEQEFVCKKRMEKSTCCKKKQMQNSCCSKNKKDCNTTSKFLQFDFEVVECECGKPIDFSIIQPFANLFDYFYYYDNFLSLTLSDIDLPPLVGKNILSLFHFFRL